MIRSTSRARALCFVVSLCLALAGACSPSSSGPEETFEDDPPRCPDCVGEDGGESAPPAVEGQTVAVLETQFVPVGIDEYILRGTFPVPPRTFPQPDLRDPFVVLDWDGQPVTTQTQLVSRYADGADGADVVEVLAKVHRAPGAQSVERARHEVVFAPHPALPGPGTVGLEDLLATSDVGSEIQAVLDDPSSIEILSYDCFGNKYVCRPLDGTGHLEILRRGPVLTEMRVFQTMQPEPFVANSTLPRFFGVHVYLSTLTGQNFMGMSVRFTNGGSGRDTSTPEDDPLDKIYFEKIQIALPPNMGLVQEFDDPFLGGFVFANGRWIWDLVRPLDTNKLHVMRWLGQFHRRLWLAGPSASGNGSAHSAGYGQAFCAPGTDSGTGREYWSWWNRGTARYFPQKFLLPSLDHVGLGNLRAQLFGSLQHLEERLRNGTSDGNYPIASGVLGWGHPYGVSYGGMTSGNEIFCFDGITTAAAGSINGLQMHKAIHRMHSDRQPNVLIDADGEPTSVERWLIENGNLDYVPIYHYIVPLLGGSYPDPFGFAAAPRFQTNYVANNDLKPGYELAHLAYDPHDFQHFIRYTRSAKVLAWLANDSIAKDDLRTQAEMFHLSYHSHRNDPNGLALGSGLRAQMMLVAGNPHKGGPFGRGEAWGLDAAVAAYGLGKNGWRTSKRPWFETILQLLSDQQGTCNGFFQAQVSSKAVDGRYRARQQIEQSITENALQGLRESVFRTFDPSRAHQTRAILIDSLYAFIGNMAWSPGVGPWRYTGVGPLDISLPLFCSRADMPNDAVSAGDFETYQDWSSLAYGYELTGDPIFLERALEQLQGATDLLNRLRSDGTNNIENRAALVALVQHLNGVL